MAIRVCSGPYEYTLIADRESAVPSVFMIRELSERELTKLRDIMHALPDMDVDADAFRSVMADACLIGIIEARDCLDGDDNMCDMPGKDVVEMLRHSDAIIELAMAVMKKNTLVVADKKKSDSPSEQPVSD